MLKHCGSVVSSTCPPANNATEMKRIFFFGLCNIFGVMYGLRLFSISVNLVIILLINRLIVLSVKCQRIVLIMSKNIEKYQSQKYLSQKYLEPRVRS